MKSRVICLLAVLGCGGLTVLGAAPRKPAPKKPSAARPVRKTPPADVVLAFPKGAQVLRNGKPVRGVRQGTALRPADVLKTGKTGNLDVRLASIASVRVKPGSTVRLSTLNKQPAKNDPNTRHTRLKLDRGTILVRLAKLKGKSRFIIDTPGAVTAARGTSFLVQTHKGVTTTVVEEGLVSVALARAPAKELLIGPQLEATVGRKLPAAPRLTSERSQRRLEEVRGLPAATRSTETQGETSSAEMPLLPAPAGAKVLFNGRSLVGWTASDGSPATWKVENGYTVATPADNDIRTDAVFTDFQLHAEYWLPIEPELPLEQKLNSGIYLQGLYELQIIDSFDMPPSMDTAGAYWGVAAPLRNAARPPGQWQWFDIRFRAPRYDTTGQLQIPGTMTVYHNGVQIHSAQPVVRPTGGALGHSPSEPGPIMLQALKGGIRFRNIWIAPLRFRQRELPKH